MQQEYSLSQDPGRVRIWRFCLIKYARNGPFNESGSFGIPGLIFQAVVTKFGVHMGLNMLIKLTPGFSHNHKNNLGDSFTHFSTFHIENQR